MTNGLWALAALATLAWAGTACAENLSLPVEKHSVSCASLAACPIRKPAGVGGWELLSKDVSLEEKGEGVWLADFSKAKTFKSGKARLRVLATNGRVIDIGAEVSKQ